LQTQKDNKKMRDNAKFSHFLAKTILTKIEDGFILYGV